MEKQSKAYGLTGMKVGIKISPRNQEKLQPLISRKVFIKKLKLPNNFMQEFFIVSRVSREDLESRGYDTLHLTDDAMAEIARRMGEGINESGAFWDALDNVCDRLEVTKTIK